MKNNEELQINVQNAIKWEPSMQAAEIGVTAKDGVVTLSGTVDSYSKKLNAEKVTKKIHGVKAVAEDIVVKSDLSSFKNDTEIAHDILNAWKHSWEVPESKIQFRVENGWVELDGDLPWKYQEQAALKSIKHLEGVIGITNLLKVKSESKDVVEQKAIEKALKRNWSINSKDIIVAVDNNHIKLTGLVHSLYQKDEAGRLAWNSPGVMSVGNELSVI